MYNIADVDYTPLIPFEEAYLEGRQRRPPVVERDPVAAPLTSRVMPAELLSLGADEMSPAVL